VAALAAGSEWEMVSELGLGMALGLPSVLALRWGAWVLPLAEVALGWAEEWAQTLRWRR
jgi:hypothetical protein